MRSELSTLLSMLTYARPMGGRMDTNFRTRYLLTLPDAWEDTHGNIHVVIGGSSRTLFSSHTDTVHRNDTRQTVSYDDVLGIIRLAKGSPSNCLGADDTVGVWLMCEMIRANRPGYYVFHYGEERGGIGSSALAKTSPDWLRETFSRAIAFDRRGTQDVITHQGGGRCASNAFASALADALNTGTAFGYSPCSTGIYTDTAEYAHLIPECTNVSVGYANEHTRHETINVTHALALRDRLLTLDFETLPAERVPVAVTRYSWHDTDIFSTYAERRNAFLSDEYEAVHSYMQDAETVDDIMCPDCTGLGYDDDGFACDTCDAYGVVPDTAGLSIDALESEYEFTDFDSTLHKLTKHRLD